MFIDKVEIIIKAGSGGDGHTSFFRDKLTMKGGPDGGDGGKGGDIVFIGDTRADNLVDFRFNKKFRAADGENGGKRHRTGKSGADLRISVPLGTKIYKVGAAKSMEGKVSGRAGGGNGNELVADIVDIGQEFRALRGGAGGRGNARFATSKKQTPNFSQDGIKTSEYRVLLELNCIADIGLIGFPNVGKSTLLSVISRANPKIADYHFTSLHPNIGVASVHGKNVVVADIPGLIEGASKGAGLGIDFLKHINRTRLLVHIVDISEREGRSALSDFEIINNELAAFSAQLASKPQIVALNKSDLVSDRAQVENFLNAITSKNKEKNKCSTVDATAVFEISAATHKGVDELMSAAAVELEKLPKVLATAPKAQLEQQVDKNTFNISGGDGVYFVSGAFIDNLIRGVVLSDTESNAYFQRRLIESGIIDALKARGMQNGDTVHVADFEFDYVE